MEEGKEVMVCVAIFRFSYRADILKGILAEAGIESWISKSSIFRQIDTVKLMINNADIEEARQIIQDYRKVTELDDIEEL